MKNVIVKLVCVIGTIVFLVWYFLKAYGAFKIAEYIGESDMNAWEIVCTTISYKIIMGVILLLMGVLFYFILKLFKKI